MKLVSATRRTDAYLVAAATLVATAPVSVYILRLLLHRPAIFFGNDVALVELATRAAAHGHQTLGPYSRFGWHHPGPAWFYWLALPYRLLGSRSWAVLVGVCSFHIAVIAILLAVAHRHGGRRLLLLATGLIVVYFRAVDINLFLYPWNPWALVLPIALLVILGATGSGSPLPRLLWMMAVGSVVVQTHLGTTPTVVAVIGATAVMTVRPARPTEWGAPRAIAIPAAAVVLLWTPPLIEQLTHGTGNFGLLLSFFRTRHPGHAIGQSISVVGSQLRRFPFERGRDVNAGVPLHPGDALIVAGYLGAALTVAYAGHRRQAALAFRTGILVAIALLAAVVSVSRITGQPYDFLVTWISVLTIPLWLAAADLIASEWPRDRTIRQRGGIAAVVLTVGLAIATSRPVSRGVLGTPDIVDVRSSWATVRASLGGRQPVLIRIVDDDQWATAAGLTLQFEKAGWPVAVTDHWLFMFGEHYRASGQERVAVELRDGASRTSTIDVVPLGG